MLVLAFIRALQPDVVVETGTSTGATAEAIAKALRDNGHGHLWTVEIDENLARQAVARLEGLPATVHCADSRLWIPPELPVDFAWIDSGDAFHRIGEVRRWKPLFRPGAIVGVHDTAPNMGRQVLGNGLADLLHEFGWQSLRLHTPRGVTFAQVP